MRIASRGIEKAGVSTSKALSAERKYELDNKSSNFPDKIYRAERDRALLIIHFVKAKAPKGKEDHQNSHLIPKDPVLAWGISLPRSKKPTEKVKYIVNSQRYTELFGSDDIDEEMEDTLNE